MPAPSEQRVETSPTDPANLGALVQAYVTVQCSVILETRDAIAAHDESAVHPARVAIRRLRATLQTFGAVYERVDRRSLAKELRWWGRLLGGVRDLQVLAKRFADSDTPPELREALAHELAHDQDRAWDAVADALDTARAAALYSVIARWRDMPPFSAEADRPPSRARTLVEEAHALVQRRLRRTRTAAKTGDPAAADLLHAARKAAKTHRYAVELAADTLGTRTKEVIERGQLLQDVLGAHQDAVVALAYLRRLEARETAPAIASGMSELIAGTRESADDVTGVLRAVRRLQR